MQGAIFGLIGVIVGAVVTGGVNFYFERRRETAAMRQAIRLTLLSLREHLRWLDSLGLPGTSFVPPEIPGLRVDEWAAHADLLALRLPDEAWWRLDPVFALLPRTTALLPRLDDDPSEREKPAIRGHLQETRDALREAIIALAQVSGDRRLRDEVQVSERS